MTGGNITNNLFLFAHPGFDTLKDFDAVTLAAQTPVVLAVNPSVPAKTVMELVAWIKANPGKESYASPGTGTPPQLTGALFVHALNLDLVHVPFNGGGPAVEATVGNHTPISFGAMAPAVPLIKNGDLRALAVTGKTRSPTLPTSRPWRRPASPKSRAPPGPPSWCRPARRKTSSPSCTT